MNEKFVKDFEEFTKDRDNFTSLTKNVLTKAIAQFNEIKSTNYAVTVDSIEDVNLERVEISGMNNFHVTGYMEKDILWFCTLLFMQQVVHDTENAANFFMQFITGDCPMEAYTKGIDYIYGLVMGEGK